MQIKTTMSSTIDLQKESKTLSFLQLIYCAYCLYDSLN